LLLSPLPRRRNADDAVAVLSACRCRSLSALFLRYRRSIDALSPCCLRTAATAVAASLSLMSRRCYAAISVTTPSPFYRRRLRAVTSLSARRCGDFAAAVAMRCRLHCSL
jgi:hypothetical protein